MKRKIMLPSVKLYLAFVVSLTSAYSNSNQHAASFLLHCGMNPADAGQAVQECDATEA